MIPPGACRRQRQHCCRGACCTTLIGSPTFTPSQLSAALHFSRLALVLAPPPRLGRVWIVFVYFFCPDLWLVRGAGGLRIAAASQPWEHCKQKHKATTNDVNVQFYQSKGSSSGVILCEFLLGGSRMVSRCTPAGGFRSAPAGSRKAQPLTALRTSFVHRITSI